MHALVLCLMGLAAPELGPEPREVKAVGVQGPVGCRDNPKKVDRLEITSPGVYENYLVDSNWAGGNRVKITADDVDPAPLRDPQRHRQRRRRLRQERRHRELQDPSPARTPRSRSSTTPTASPAAGATSPSATARSTTSPATASSSTPTASRRGNVLIEDCTFWTGPLPADAAGFKKGERPGENAIDTKTHRQGRALHADHSQLLLPRLEPARPDRQPGRPEPQGERPRPGRALPVPRQRDRLPAARPRQPRRRPGRGHATAPSTTAPSACAWRTRSQNLKIDRLGFGAGVHAEVPAGRRRRRQGI